MAGLIEILDRVATFFLVAEKIPILGKILKTTTEKGGEVIGKKMESVIGSFLDAEAAKKTFDDEISFEKVVATGTLASAERQVLMSYVGRLRGTTPDLASELTRWVHNTLVANRQQVKLSTGQKENREERTSVDDSEGIQIAENLLLDIIKATDDSAREEILKQRDIRIREKKTPKGVETAKKVGSAVASQQKANFDDHKKTATSFEAAGKKYLEEVRAKRRAQK
ncbi:MAG TPA: hypothetical protein DCS28_03565 [Candidatus Moranbacteria bacterium]|nr:hypothetical protein [Candidatus Moranbacteria bacterium]HAT75090.1 hypothetical protein [Candidatus Moranbacteria bacterium]